MKTINIEGYTRDIISKSNTKLLRVNANVPGVLYGGKESIKFYASMASLNDLVYSPDSCFVDLKIGDTSYKCVMQDIQFHPVSEMILHVDMLQVFSDKRIKLSLPVNVHGKSVGVSKGGNLSVKTKKLTVVAYPDKMPEAIKVDVSSLDLGDMIRVKDVKDEDYEIINPDGVPLVSVEMSRALRSAASKDK